MTHVYIILMSLGQGLSEIVKILVQPTSGKVNDQFVTSIDFEVIRSKSGDI